jgi:hypothetical protein
MTSSVGVSGDIGMAESAVSVIPRSWSATAFRGLSAPDDGAGLPRGGVDAGRRAVFSNGIGGGCSRLRFGDAYAIWVGGISPDGASPSYMGAVVGRGQSGIYGEGDVVV